MQRSKSSFGIRLHETMQLLPSVQLLFETRVTEDLVNEYASLNLNNQLVGLLLRERFQPEDKVLEKIKTVCSPEIYEVSSAYAQHWISFYNLLREIWMYLKKDFEKPEYKNKVTSSQDLFLLVLQESCDNRFRERVDGCNYTKHNTEDYLRLETKYLQSQVTVGSSPTVFKKDTRTTKLLNDLASKQGLKEDSWYNYVICNGMLSKKRDSVANKAFQDYIKDYQYLKDLAFKLIQKDRQGTKKLCSVVYSNQIRVL